jgi:hypothetical protein
MTRLESRLLATFPSSSWSTSGFLIPPEERFLAERYGDAYREYARVGEPVVYVATRRHRSTCCSIASFCSPTRPFRTRRRASSSERSRPTTGVRLHAWYAPAAASERSGAWPRSSDDACARLVARKWGKHRQPRRRDPGTSGAPRERARVRLPGYGRSQGRPSEAGVYGNARAPTTASASGARCRASGSRSAAP